MTKEGKRAHAKQKNCHICGGKIDEGKVRDHCHIMGKFRGAAHQSCNLNYRLSKTIPVVFHNLSGYDAHFLVLGMSEFKRGIGIIPNNFEKYMSVSWGKLRFIDSFQFMSAGLASLVDNLPGEYFTNTGSEFSGQKLDLLKRKGVYPYEYFDRHERFDEKQLPPIEAFFSRIKGEGISDEDYDHAKAVWSAFGMETLGDYHNKITFMGGRSMSQPLPTGGFKFHDEAGFDLTSVRDNDSKGYYLEVDLHIPNELHDYMSDYPIAPEKMVVTDEMLSGYSRGIKDSLNCDSGNVEKLLTTLLPKKRYVLHHENLRLYLSLGAVLTKIHRVIEFDQSPFLKAI